MDAVFTVTKLMTYEKFKAWTNPEHEYCQHILEEGELLERMDHEVEDCDLLNPVEDEVSIKRNEEPVVSFSYLLLILGVVLQVERSICVINWEEYLENEEVRSCALEESQAEGMQQEKQTWDHVSSKLTPVEAKNHFVRWFQGHQKCKKFNQSQENFSNVNLCPIKTPSLLIQIDIYFHQDLWD